MTPCRRPAGLIFLALLILAACTGGTGADGAIEPSETAIADAAADQAEANAALAAYAVYRAGVGQGDGEAVINSVTAASLVEEARLADLARTADERTVRGLPAADQLIVLTYRLRPELLDEDDPFRARVDLGLAGQDRSLGEIGAVELVTEDRAVGQVVDAASGAPTPLRWRFEREGGAWKFDLVDAHRLLSQTIADGARTNSVGVDDVVAATIQDLSGEPAAMVQALYTPTP